MKIRTLILAALIGASAICASAQEPWIHVYCTDKSEANKEDPNNHGGVGQYYSMPLSEVDSTRFSKLASNGRFNRMRVHGQNKDINVLMRYITGIKIAPNTPSFHINITDDPQLNDVESKEDYLSATLSVDGMGVFDDFEGEIQVRGRGNSTWNYPKKPYRIKLPSKESICGFTKAKNYVLLANYIDPTMMRSAVASMAAQYAGMPYPTHSTPVDIYFNKNYKGSYTLTEKVGFNNGSINLSKTDEENAILFELDTNFDEDLRACSKHFRLPIVVKDPDAPEDSIAAQKWFEEWLMDFDAMEYAVKQGENIEDHIDYNDLARFLLVFNLAANQELNHPKSIYLYKVLGDKWHFGPCWDFDWAYGYQPTYRRAQSDSEIDEATAKQMIADLLKYIEDNNIVQYYYFQYNGDWFIWFGGTSFAQELPNGELNFNWPYGSISYLPSYENFLLGDGKNNQNTANGMGNGGEFFMSIVMNNPEFLAAYKSAWEEFKNNLPAFWADFDSYAASLEPTAARNSTIWPSSNNSAIDSEFSEFNDGTHKGAVQILRKWLEKRIEFMDREDCNYGLWDPNTTYQRGTIRYESYYPTSENENK